MEKPLTFTFTADNLPLSAFDRGLHYGHGIFETMLLFDGDIPLRELHLARAGNGCEKLGITFDRTLLDANLKKVIAQVPAEGILKLVITAGVTSRGYAYPQETQPTLIFQWFPHGARIKSPLALTTCGYRLPLNSALAGIKHLNRLDQVMAARELDEGKQGLILDSLGNVVECLSHNLFFLRQGVWKTPLLDNAGVKGVMRQYLLEAVFPELGISVVEGLVTMDELLEASEVFACNAVTGITPIQSLDNRELWNEWPNSHRVQAVLARSYSCFIGW